MIDTFGFCPISYKLNQDNRGLYKQAFCNIATFRSMQDQIIDPYVARAARWARLPVLERAWHERNWNGECTESVFYVLSFPSGSSQVALKY